MSGEIESEAKKSIDQRREKIESEIQKFIDNLGIPSSCPNSELAKQYLSCSRDELDNLTKEECLNRCYVLGQHSLYVQLQYNKENARVKWSNNMLGKMASKDNYNSKDTKWVNFEEKKLRIALNDTAAERLLDIKVYSETRMTQLESLSFSINNLINTLRELSKIRGDKNG